MSHVDAAITDDALSANQATTTEGSAADQNATRRKLMNWLRRFCDVRVSQLGVMIEEYYAPKAGELSPSKILDYKRILKLRLALIDLYLEVFEVGGVRINPCRSLHLEQTRYFMRDVDETQVDNVDLFIAKELLGIPSFVDKIRKRWVFQDDDSDRGGAYGFSAPFLKEELGDKDVSELSETERMKRAAALDPFDFRIDPLYGYEREPSLAEQFRKSSSSEGCSVFDLDKPPIANLDLVYDPALRDRSVFR